MPTGGVEPTEASLRSWFEAGAACVGMGSNMITKDMLKAGDYRGIGANIGRTVQLIRTIRAK
jgi:2-dehydro-3-deoxyphosphogluconate aldolase/(4S)-4-hydroxy-2-oxoglutarate aldolase